MPAQSRQSVSKARRPRGRAAPGRAAAAGGALALGPALTITEVASAHRALQRLLAAGKAAADARTLRSIDTAGLQLLLIAGRAARERGLTLRIAGAGELLAGAAEAVGLREQLAAAVELSA